MKEFTVKSNDKEYKVKANDFRSAVKAVKAVTAKDDRKIRADEVKLGMMILSDPLFDRWDIVKEITRYDDRLTFHGRGSSTFKSNEFVTVKDSFVKDDATQLDVIQALVTDEQAAIAAYANAIKNLDGKVDPQYIEVLRNILKEENKHVENLQAIITGNVTEKNVEDSVKNAYGYVEIHNTGEQRDFGLKFGLKLQNQIDWKNWRRVEVLTKAAADEIERAGYTVRKY